MRVRLLLGPPFMIFRDNSTTVKTRVIIRVVWDRKTLTFLDLNNWDDLGLFRPVGVSPEKHARIMIIQNIQRYRFWVTNYNGNI